MDSEILKLVETAVREGATSTAWLLLFVTSIAAGLGSYLGSFFTKEGELRALKRNFAEHLKQLEVETKITAKINHEFQTELENLKSLLAQDVFVRALYADGIRQYSSEQGYALRQAYLVVYEPKSSTLDSAGENTEIRLEAAIQCVMQPLRKHIGLLDEQTISRIYDAQNELDELKGRSPDELQERKNQVFNLTEVARKFVKADLIAHRLGLIQRPLSVKENVHDETSMRS